MAKITITIEDTDKGPVKGSVRFEPAINLSGEMTGTPALYTIRQRLKFSDVANPYG